MRGLFLFVLIGLFCQQSMGAIYGPDNRKDISKSQLKWQKAADSVALVLPLLFLEELDSENYFHSEYKNRNYADEVGVCKDEKFANQSSFGHCTSFLVAPNVMVSAGHCFLPTGTVENQAHSYCENFVFWMGYNDKNYDLPGIGSLIPKKDVALCKKVIYASNNEQMDPENNPIDFAIYELSEPLLDREPLKIAKRPLKKNQMIATVGHPHGLPAKFSGLSRVRDVFDTTYSSNMDSLGGNSGGPAFNNQAEVVGILIAGHQFDTYEDKAKRCDRINVCNASGTKCKMDSGLEESNLLLRNKVWMPYVENFLNK